MIGHGRLVRILRGIFSAGRGGASLHVQVMNLANARKEFQKETNVHDQELTSVEHIE